MATVSIRLSGWRRREGCDLAVKLIAEALGNLQVEAKARSNDVVGRCRAVDPDTGKTWESTESMAPPPTPSSEEARP